MKDFVSRVDHLVRVVADVEVVDSSLTFGGPEWVFCGPAWDA